MSEEKHDVVREIMELKSQLSSAKRIGFFFGAGTSMSMGIPGITELTEQAIASLSDDEKIKIEKIITCMKSFSPGFSITIEDILNHIRLVRQITRDSDSKGFEGINGIDAKNLDKNICSKIYDIITKKEHDADRHPMVSFASWLNWFPRDYNKEIFTLNYDLILEKSFEELQIPYFDGFIGANEPFFLAESIESKDKLNLPPLSWIRLWKLHGSFGWIWQKVGDDDAYRIVRVGALGGERDASKELVIYPSRDKYELSRKQPFTAYFDKLRNYLQEGELLFVINGYSFSDEHINEVLFSSLRQNNRLHIIAFVFNDTDLEKIKNQVRQHLNITVYCPSFAIIGGFLRDWDFGKDKEKFSNYLNDDGKKLKLGDFKNLVLFLIENRGKNFNSNIKDDMHA
jgi:hypothetical protein